MELKKLNERLHQVETTLENKVKTLKTQKHLLNQCLILDTPKTPIVSPNTEPTKGSKNTCPICKSYAQIAALSSTKSGTKNIWTKVTSGNQKQKSNIPNLPKLELERRRVIFRQGPTSPEKSKVDLILVLNESLQKTGILAYTWFNRVGYLQSGAISILLIEKSNAENLVRDHSNMLIRVAKSVDKKVIGRKALEHWQKFKVHGMPLAQYLGEGKIELLCQEIKSSIRIKLKTLPHWFICETWLEKRLESRSRRGSAIVITVRNNAEAFKLYSKRLRFEEVLKVVEKYWKAGINSIYMSCASVGHNRLGECENRAIWCIISASNYEVENYRYGVTDCTIKMGKICAHVTSKYANYRRNDQATAIPCPTRLKAQAEA